MEDDYAEVLAENLEYMYNKLCCIRTFNENANSVCENDLDIYKTLLWELFICIIVYMRHIKDYAAINVLLTYTYFLETSLFGGVIKQANYTAFQHYICVPFHMPPLRCLHPQQPYERFPKFPLNSCLDPKVFRHVCFSNAYLCK